MDGTEQESPATSSSSSSFYQALKEKYLEDQYCPSNFTVIKPKRNPNHKDAELAHLKTIVLNGSDISSSGICHLRLSDLCPNVTDLDLAYNTLEKWSEVVTILCHLPRLKYVNLSNNPLRIETTHEDPKESLMIETLALNRTKISIDEVLRLSDFFPCLKELQLSGNDYEHLGKMEDSIKKGAFNTLESLTFYRNKIQKWSEIWKLRNLPVLKSLIVSENPLSDLFYFEENFGIQQDVQECQHSQYKKVLKSDNSDSDPFLCNDQSPNTDTAPSKVTVLSCESGTFPDTVTSRQQEMAQDVAETFLNEIMENITQSQLEDNSNALFLTTPDDNCECEFSMTSNYPNKSPQGEVNIEEIQTEFSCGNDNDEYNYNVSGNIENMNYNNKQVNVDRKDDVKGPNIHTHKSSLLEDHAQDLFVNNNYNSSGSNEGGIGTDENENDGCEITCHKTVLKDTQTTNEVAHGNVSTTSCDQTLKLVDSDDVDSTGTLISQNDFVKKEEDAVQKCEQNDNNDLRPFTNLETLCLSNARISCDEDLEALSCFPKLSNLRVSCNHLYSDIDPDPRRQLYIASLPNIKILNGSEVSPSEREKAERHYLRHFMNAPKKPNSYHRLVRKHGPPVELVDIDLKAGFHEWATLTFVYKGERKLSQRVRVFDPISKLRPIIAEAFKIPKKGFVMYFNPCNPIHPEYERDLVELRCENLPMSRLNLSDGDEIHVDKKPMFNTRVTFHQKH